MSGLPDHSVPNHPMSAPSPLLHATPQLDGSPAGTVGADGSRLRTWLAGSPRHLAESGSLSYGLVVHPLLLSTSPHGDAVTGGYGLESVLPGEDLHLSDLTRLQAH